MQSLRTGMAMLCIAAAATACSGSGNTGSAGGWRVSGAHIRIVGVKTTCRTPAPRVDTFFATPSPQPGCTPAAGSLAAATAAPDVTPTPVWQPVHTDQTTTSGAGTGWRTVYTTYTPLPATGVYQPVVQASQQPMPTPFSTPTPTPVPTMTPLATPSPVSSVLP